MPSVTIPDAIRVELNDRRKALDSANKMLLRHNEEKEAAMRAFDEKAETLRGMRNRIAEDIALIERILAALEQQREQQRASRVTEKQRRMESAKEKVIRVLSDANKPMRGREIMDATGLSQGAVAICLRRLREKGALVRNDETSQYTIA